MSFFHELDQMRRRTYAMGRALNNVEHAVQGLIAATNGTLPPVPPQQQEVRPAVQELEPRSIDETIDSFDGGSQQLGESAAGLHAAVSAAQRHPRYTPPPVPDEPQRRPAPPIDERYTRPGGGPVQPNADYIEPWPNPDEARSGGSW